MKHLINSITVITLGLVLGACSKKDFAKAQFQAQAEKQLLSIANKLSSSRGAASGGNRGIYTSSNWQPYQNVYQHKSVEEEIRDCKQFNEAIPSTKANFKSKISVFYQCVMQVMQYRNSFQTAFYRNLNDGYNNVSYPQQLDQYTWTWRYPATISNYSSLQSQYPTTFSYQNTYGSNGYLPTTVQYN